MDRHTGRGLSIDTASARVGAVWGAQARVRHNRRKQTKTDLQNRARTASPPARWAKKLLTGSGHDLVRGWYRWSGVRGCRVGGWIKTTHFPWNIHFRPLEPKSCFRFRLPAQTDLAQASGHPKPSRMHQHFPPYLQSSSRWSIYTLVRRTTFLPCRLGFQFETPLSPVESFCTVTPKRKNLNARRTTQCMRIDSYACADF